VNLTPENLEALVMAHRYLYYVLNTPIISDYEYNQLEHEAREVLPKSSPVHSAGSEANSSYSDYIRMLALQM